MTGVNYLLEKVCIRCGKKYDKDQYRCDEPDCKAKLRSKPKWSGRKKEFKRI